MSKYPGQHGTGQGGRQKDKAEELQEKVEYRNHEAIEELVIKGQT